MSDVTVQDEPANKTDTQNGQALVVPSGGAVASPATAVQPNTGARPPPSFGEAVFNENITVYPGQPLPHLNKNAVKAFAARGTNSKAPTHMFAMICEDHLTPRSQKASNYAAIINPSLVRLVASGAIDWPPAGRQKYCFIYESMIGKPLMAFDTQGGGGMKPDYVMNAVIRPLVHVLADLRDKDIVHGNIRPANIFDNGTKLAERAVLGECLCLPVSYDQPALYETINRAMANPAGRGTGTAQDDLYAFGVSLAVMMRQNDPLEGLTDDEIIVRKIEDGTYFSLLSKDRFSGGTLELLRGLLHDDIQQRWTLDDVMSWLDGRRLSPKQPGRRSRANRPLAFNNERYVRPELIARDLNKNVNEARQIIDTGEMEQWLARALEDKEAVARYNKALSLAEDGGKGGGYAERLVTRVAIALDPEGPMRYKNLSLLPDGIGAALAEAFIMKRDLQTYIDFFMTYFITQWVDAQPGPVPDVSNMVSKFDGARAFLRNKTIGGGLEKCIYWLNPEVHCLSEKLQKYYVRTPEDMMHAFEKMATQPGRPSSFFDRQIIAFLSVRDRKSIEPYLNELSAPETYRRVMAEIKVLATIQKRSQLERFPGIAAWMFENLTPIYERFHDRELRVELEKKAAKIKITGDLVRLVVVFDDLKLYEEDNLNFRRAMQHYYNLEAEHNRLERDLKEDDFGRTQGQQAAAMLAVGLSFLIILLTSFTSFMAKGHHF